MDSNNVVLNRVFSRKTIRDLISGHRNPAYSAVVQQYLGHTSAVTNRDIIHEIYDTIRRCHRNEYFYKNTLLTKLLLGRHSTNTTTALTEVQVEGSKADFVLINGRAVVYEIKTELDTLERLDGQIRNYYKAFTNVCVLTSESHYQRVEALLRSSPQVGICVLTDRGTISTKREPSEDVSQLDHRTMFKILRKSEYEYVLSEFFGTVPKCPPAHYYKECLRLFCQLNTKAAYNAFIKQLKKRVTLRDNDYVEYVPYELKFLVYFSNFKANDYRKLDSFLNEVWEG